MAPNKQQQQKIQHQKLKNLDYVATYPNDGILFRKSDMILAANADAGFLKELRPRIRAGAHIFLSKMSPNQNSMALS